MQVSPTMSATAVAERVINLRPGISYETLGGELRTVTLAGMAPAQQARQHRLEYVRRMLRQKLGPDSPIKLDAHKRTISVPTTATGEPMEIPVEAKKYLRELVQVHGYVSQTFIA